MRNYELDDFTFSYIECALWAECDNEDESLDSNYDYDNIEHSSMLAIIAECKDFQIENKLLLEQAYTLYSNYEFSPEAIAGHDYWLTRNGHGVGFWDRELGEVGDKLTTICQYQQRHLLVNDSGKLDYVRG